uniref:acid phosphatase n=1 Tax=Panagrellus redivivus TaxID=6233 RepID=A0A7E4ZSJ5_PANRE
MQVFVLLLSSLLEHAVVATKSQDELVLAQVIWRHGSRAPTDTYPRNPNTEKAWPLGMGQLTKRGMDQSVELGKTLKELYIDKEDPLISPFPVSGEYRIQSTEFDRVMASAAGVAAGMFPKFDGAAAQNYLVPIFANNLTTDADLNIFISCPRYDEFVDDAFVKLAKLENDHKWLFDLAKQNTGKNYTLRNIWEVYDNYACDSLENLKPATWLTPAVLKVMKKLIDVELEALLGLLFEEDKFRQHTRLRGDRTLKTFVDLFAKRIKCDGNDSPDCVKTNKLKFYGYSAHDLTIAHMMTTMTRDLRFIVPGYMVDYMGAFSFELWKRNGKFDLRILYRPGEGTRFKPVTGQIIQSESEYWDFEDFLSRVTPYIPQDFESECSPKKLVREKRNYKPDPSLSERRYPGWDVALKTNTPNEHVEV